MDADVEQAGGGDQSVGGGAVGGGRARIARGMVVGDDQGGGLEVKRAADDHPRLELGAAGAAAGDLFLGEPAAAGVEEDDEDAFDLAVGEAGPEVADEFGPGAGQRLALGRQAQDLGDGGAGGAQLARDRFVAGDAEVRLGTGGENLGERAEAGEERTGVGGGVGRGDPGEDVGQDRVAAVGCGRGRGQPRLAARMMARIG